MAEDRGIWFVNGKVSNADEREYVWNVFNKKRDRYVHKLMAMQDRHRKEQAELEKELAVLMKQQPYTPWVGREDQGAVVAFVESSMAEWKRRRAIVKRDRVSPAPSVAVLPRGGRTNLTVRTSAVTTKRHRVGTVSHRNPDGQRHQGK